MARTCSARRLGRNLEPKRLPERNEVGKNKIYEGHAGLYKFMQGYIYIYIYIERGVGYVGFKGHAGTHMIILGCVYM